MNCHYHRTESNMECLLQSKRSSVAGDAFSFVSCCVGTSLYKKKNKYEKTFWGFKIYINNRQKCIIFPQIRKLCLSISTKCFLLLVVLQQLKEKKIVPTFFLINKPFILLSVWWLLLQSIWSFVISRATGIISTY